MLCNGYLDGLLLIYSSSLSFEYLIPFLQPIVSHGDLKDSMKWTPLLENTILPYSKLMVAFGKNKNKNKNKDKDKNKTGFVSIHSILSDPPLSRHPNRRFKLGMRRKSQDPAVRKFTVAVESVKGVNQATTAKLVVVAKKDSSKNLTSGTILYSPLLILSSLFLSYPILFYSMLSYPILSYLS